jgi:hypothetical protein
MNTTSNHDQATLVAVLQRLERISRQLDQLQLAATANPWVQAAQPEPPNSDCAV